jgi:hypothetical protein
MLGAASLLLLNLAIKAIVDFNYSELVLSILFVSMLIYVAGYTDRSSMNVLSRRSIASLTIAGAVFVALYQFLMQTYSSYTYFLLYPTYIAVCILVLLLLWRTSFFRDLNFQRLLFLYLLAGPLTAVFGSSNDLIAGATKYLAPWYILVMYFAYAGSFQPPARAKQAGALSAVVVLLCLLSLTQVFYVQGIKPYHLSTTMLRQTESITPPGRLTGLRVDREVAEFYGALTSLLQPQLERNRGILNLTQRPSVVYAVGGHAVGQLYYDRRGVFSERLCRYLQSKIGQTRPVIFTEITIDAIQPPTSRCLERIDIDLEQDYRLLQRFKWPYRKKTSSFFYVYVYDAT